MKTFSRSDVLDIVREMKSLSMKESKSLEPEIGPDGREKIVIGPGLKIRHKSSGLVYTVSRVEGNICFAQRPGKEISISFKDLKGYERE